MSAVPVALRGGLALYAPEAVGPGRLRLAAERVHDSHGEVPVRGRRGDELGAPLLGRGCAQAAEDVCGATPARCGLSARRASATSGEIDERCGWTCGGHCGSSCDAITITLRTDCRCGWTCGGRTCRRHTCRGRCGSSCDAGTVILRTNRRCLQCLHGRARSCWGSRRCGLRRGLSHVLARQRRDSQNYHQCYHDGGCRSNCRSYR